MIWTLPEGVKATHGDEIVIAHIGKPAALVSEEASGTEAASESEVPAIEQKNDAAEEAPAAE